MSTELIAVAFTILFTIATSALLGLYMARVFTGGRTFLDPVLVPIERLVLRVTGVNPGEQQDWKQYSVSLLVSNVVMWLATFAAVKGLRKLFYLSAVHRFLQEAPAVDVHIVTHEAKDPKSTG